MRTRVLRADARPPELIVKRIWFAVIDPGQAISYQTRVVLVSKRSPLELDDFDDGTSEADVRDAIAAAALADDWPLANSIANEYGLAACLRCGANVAERPTWRLHRLMPETKGWGEICGSCAVKMLELTK